MNPLDNHPAVRWLTARIQHAVMCRIARTLESTVWRPWGMRLTCVNRVPVRCGEHEPEGCRRRECGRRCADTAREAVRVRTVGALDTHQAGTSDSRLQ
ncbi:MULTISPECIES: hypothetical protein [Burkholderia cepacia complex]|uniref:hypothetical protein n=1 Tax=Burkholderia cepacia complex TaxID=87882 RepID=UPI0013DE4EF3|nr:MULTISPECIES: hypothetical protein [Burkholderia cepacia complex]